MKILSNLLAVLIFLLVPNIYVVANGGQLATQQDSINLEFSCPDGDFSKFIRAFSNDEKVQRAFTTYPLKKLHLDLDAEPEPKKIIQNLERHQIHFPLFPLHEERKKRSLEVRIDSVTLREAKVTLIKPNTDYQVSYFFRKNSCWRLDRIEDWSL